MASRLAFMAVCRTRTPVLRIASSLQVPIRQRLVPYPGGCSQRPGLAFSSATSTTGTAVKAAESSSTRAETGRHPPPATASPLPHAEAAVAAAAAEATQRSSAAATNSSSNDSTAKPLPGTETTRVINNSDTTGVSSSSSADDTSEKKSGDGRTGGGSGSSSGDGGDGGDGGGGSSRGPLTWGAVGLLGVVGALAMGYYRMKWDEKQKQVASEVTSTGKPALGGPFTLVNMHGQPVTDKDYHGSFVLLYFGFCHCPDICPSELVKVGAIANKLEAKLGGGVVKPVFVSVDPDRDSLAQLRHYAQDFHPSIDYVTGTKDQVAKAAKAYRVYFSKTEEHDEGEDYLLDHSIVIYLLAPNGDFLDFFTQRATIADCVDRTVKQVKGFKA